MMIRLVLITFAILSFQCAYGAKIKVDSNPKESEVYIKLNKDSDPVKVGKTPFEGDLSAVAGGIEEAKAFIVLVKKTGFDPYRIMISNIGSSDIDLSVNLEVEKSVKLIQDFDMLAADLFDVLRMIRLKDFESSLQKLELLEKKFPHFSIIYELKASVFYMQQDFKKSLNFYRKAFSLNPKNHDAYRMKRYLEKKFKIFDKTDVENM